jgi:sugar transferase (PEP-CTERM/EpsH1 system associated)
MRILLLSSWFPYPPNNGARIRIFNLLKELSKDHEITLISFACDEQERQLASYVKEYCSDVKTVLQKPYRPRSLTALLGFFFSEPRSSASTYNTEMERLVRACVADNAFDIVWASTATMARYALLAKNVPKVLEEQNSMMRMMREQYLAQPNPLRRFRYWLTWQKCKRYEAWLLSAFDLCTMVSDKDRNARLELAPDQSVAVVPNGVDLEHYTTGLARPQPASLIYSGALTYHANFDAVKFFLSQIYPLIKEEVAEVTFRVTGETRGVPLQGLPADTSVEFTGYMEDIRPYVAGSWACVVPLRIGGGTRLKILEAMALGTPVVATSKGAEGLEVTDRENILIADEPTDFADQVLHLLRDPGLREKLSKGGRRLVVEKYDWKVIGREFSALLQQIATPGRILS